MSQNKKALEYFNLVVNNWVKNDIENFINVGHILYVVTYGIDIMGGIIYGFKTKSTKRSIDFMVDHMKINPTLAEFIYRFVRCGYSHEGLVKLGVHFFVNKKRKNKNVLIYKCKKSSETVLAFDITELADMFLETIDNINNTNKLVLQHIPDYSDKRDRKLALKVFNETSLNLEDQGYDFVDDTSGGEITLCDNIFNQIYNSAYRTKKL